MPFFTLHSSASPAVSCRRCKPLWDNCGMPGLLCLLFCLVCLGADNAWNRFRGPNGSGVSSDKGFPTVFGKDKNVLWRTPVRPGKSSPILTRRHVFLTAFDQ